VTSNIATAEKVIIFENLLYCICSHDLLPRHQWRL